MAESRRLLVRDAAIDALNADPPSDVPQATTRRWIPGLPLTEATIAVYFAKEQTTLPRGRLSQVSARSLMIGVQCVFPTDDVEGIDDMAEPMLAHIIAALGDTTLGGLVSDVEEIATEWEVAKPADAVYVMATIFLQFNYQTARGDMTARA